jgi:outer membrane protein TolC
MLKLQELRFLNGQADTLAVSQQREALAQARAVLPTLQQAEEQQRNALAVLLGRAGAGSLSISQATLPKLIPLPKAGLPADLLATRPDVRAAGLRLKAVDWQVSAARADRLPSLTLSAEAAVSSSSLDLLFSNWVATLAAAVTGPLFDGERREAEVDRARAEADQILTAYARTVAQAVQEVEDSLISEKRQGEYLLLLTEQLEASRLTVKTARIQYMNGQDNYLSYLTAWTSAQSLERQLVEEQATQIKNRITLYRTLGGDWTQTLISHTE